MAFVLSDRIKETTTTTGTGTYTLGGATTGFETFTANLSNGDTTYYCCTDGTDFEVGLGTFTSSGTTLARTTIISSSNSNNAVSWSSGSRDIFCTLPGSKAVFKDGSDNVNGTFVGNITGNVTGNVSGTAATVTGAAQTNITSVGTLTGLTTSGTINLSQSSGTAIKTTGSLSSADLGVIRASASSGSDTHGFTIKYMGSRTGNNNSYSLFMDNQTGTDVEAMTVLQDGKVGINNTSPSAPLDESGDAEITGTLTAGEVSATTLDIGGTNITATATEINKLDGVTATTTELNYVDVTTLGTVEASKAVTADSSGDVLFPDDKFLKFGTGGDLTIRHESSGSHSVIRESGSGNLYIDASHLFLRTSQSDGFEALAAFSANGSVELYHNNVKKFETTSDGATVTGNAAITSTADSGPVLNLISDDPSDLADFGTEGTIAFKAENSASQSVEYTNIKLLTDDITDGTEDGRIRFNVIKAGTITDVFDITSTKIQIRQSLPLAWQNAGGSGVNTHLEVATPSSSRTITLPDATGTVLTTGNSDTPTTTTSSSDADFVLVDDGGTMKKITPANLGITAGAASTDDATALAIALG